MEVKKVKADAMYPASVPRLLNVLLRKLPGEVREKVEESFRNGGSRWIRLGRFRSHLSTSSDDGSIHLVLHED
jgi:hypothetical protein